MKKTKVFLLAILLFTAGSAFDAVAQEKKQTDKERETELQDAIIEQKKAMNDQRKAQEKAQQELKENLKDLEDLKDIDVQVESFDNGDVRVYNRRGAGSRSFRMDPPVPPMPGMNSFYFHTGEADAERTSWDFSKSIKENSFKRDYIFDVEKTVKTVVMSISGDCRAGEIKIKIITPDKKNFSDIVIDEFGNLNWRKSFNISESENQDKTGEWTFQISSTKATGHFKVSLQTF